MKIVISRTIQELDKLWNFYCLPYHIDANEPHSFNSLNTLVSDQSLESTHGMVKNKATSSCLPGTNKIHPK